MRHAGLLRLWWIDPRKRSAQSPLGLKRRSSAAIVPSMDRGSFIPHEGL